ncbi:MAG: hypothetical protein LBQ76_04575 [Candidatus Fibromonas sp.]|jgi:hypothetical protein|nr:hypothetical protein [Candidatus Fibromonas sp.]
MNKMVSTKPTLAAGLVLAMALTFIGCSEQVKAANNEQPSNEQPNNEQWLLGTWVDEEDGSTWVFSSDKTGTQNGKKELGNTFKYEVTSDKLAIVIDYITYSVDYSRYNAYLDSGKSTSKKTSKKTFVFGLSTSTDGKAVILTSALGEGSLFRKKD